MRWRSATLAIGLTVLTVLAGCAGEPDASTQQRTPPSPSPKPGLQLAEPLLQDRLDATRRLLTVPLRNGGPGVAHVDRIALASPRFTDVPATTVDGDLAPGQQINFSIAYGTARCDQDAGKPMLVLEAGERVERLAVPTPAQILDRLWRSECDQKQLEAAFTIDWGQSWSQVPATDGGAARLRGGLKLTASGNERIVVTDLRGSVMFDLDTVPAGKQPITELASGSRTVPVEIGVRLCFKHGLIEAKKLFDFTLYARLGDADQVYRMITPPKLVQQRALALLATCPKDE